MLEPRNTSALSDPLLYGEMYHTSQNFSYKKTTYSQFSW